MSSRPITEMHPADSHAASLRRQDVRPLILLPKYTQLTLVASLRSQDARPLVLSPKSALPTLLWPRFGLSMYVLLFYHRNARC